MEIVIEYVLLDNFLIDAMLLIITNKTLKFPTSKLGIILASSFGAGFAVISPLINVSGFFAVCIKLLVALVMVWISGFTFKKLFLRYLIFVGYTFLFGGMLIALFNFLGVSVYDSLYIGYISSLPIGALIVGTLFFALTIFRVISAGIKSRFYGANSCDVLLKIRGREIKIKGFVDTGNTLHNSLGKPVVVVPENVLAKCFTTHERLELMLDKKCDLDLENLEILTVSSMGGQYKMKVFDCDAEINGKSKKIALGISNNKIKCGNCQGIVGQELVEV